MDLFSANPFHRACRTESQDNHSGQYFHSGRLSVLARPEPSLLVPSEFSDGIFDDRLGNDLSWLMRSGSKLNETENLLDDVRLVRRMAAGESSALGEFYDRWCATVYATI